jgi:hypothetical protein
MTDAEYDTWVVCRHKFAADGRSAVITVNSAFGKRLQFADYPYHVSIAIAAAPGAIDASGRIGAHESQHLLTLSRVIREALDREEQHIIAIVHGAGARTLELYARDGDAIAGRLNALQAEKTWDRAWNFQVTADPQGRRSQRWREIAAASQEHHLAINVPHARDGAAADHHHAIF